jgi:hypothetical protein
VRLVVTPSRCSTYRSTNASKPWRRWGRGFGACGWRRLQVPKSQRAEPFWHGGEHEGQVVQ